MHKRQLMHRPSPDHLSCREYAELHGLPIALVATATKDARLKYIKIGHYVYILPGQEVPKTRKKDYYESGE